MLSLWSSQYLVIRSNIIGSVVAAGPPVKRYVLQPRSQGQPTGLQWANKVSSSVMNNDPDVKHHVLQPRSQGQPTGLQWTNTGEWVSLGGLDGLNA